MKATKLAIITESPRGHYYITFRGRRSGRLLPLEFGTDDLKRAELYANAYADKVQRIGPKGDA